MIHDNYNYINNNDNRMSFPFPGGILVKIALYLYQSSLICKMCSLLVLRCLYMVQNIFKTCKSLLCGNFLCSEKIYANELIDA